MAAAAAARSTAWRPLHLLVSSSAQAACMAHRGLLLVLLVLGRLRMGIGRRLLLVVLLLLLPLPCRCLLVWHLLAWRVLHQSQLLLLLLLLWLLLLPGSLALHPNTRLMQRLMRLLLRAGVGVLMHHRRSAACTCS